jgi:RimJ/RimL family protein N-acetyltransferase
MLVLRILQPEDAAAYFELRRNALTDAPLAFASSSEDDICSSVEAVGEQIRAGRGNVILGAFHPHLVGAVGVYRDRHRKAAHKAHVWGMYVAPGHRRQGIATELIQAALRDVTTLPGVSRVHLSVSSHAPQALRLYERAGFQVWGTEQDAIRHDGRSAVEYHMALRLGSNVGQTDAPR